MSFLEKLLAPGLEGQRQQIAEQQAEIDAQNAELKEKQKALQDDIEKVLKHWNDSLDYRRALQHYQQILRERDAALQEKENDFFQRERELSYREKEVDERVKLRQAELREQESMMRNIEHNALITLNRWERKEWDYIQELRAEASKLSEYESIVKRKNGYRFETYVASLLEQNGFTDVEVTKKSGDYGGDVIAVKDGLKYIVQCKYYAQAVGVKAVQEVTSAIKPYGADRGAVITNNTFSSAAVQLARANRVELWDCSTIAKLNKSGDFY